MDTQKYYLKFKDGTPITLIGPTGIELPTNTIEDFGAFCGAGKGIGQKLVPETVYMLVISAACFFHDMSWEFSDGSWDDFHQSNSIFLHNLIAIIQKGSKNELLKCLRLYRAVTYYNSVDTIGAKIYKRQHEKQA